MDKAESSSACPGDTPGTPDRLGPGQDGVLDRLLRTGPDSLGDAELLALWLGFPDTDLARALLQQAGSLPELLGASSSRLCAFGLAAEQVACLAAGRSLVDRSWQQALMDGEVLSSSAAVRRFLTNRLGSQPREVFACLFLDTRHQLIAFETLFKGTVDRANVHPREVLRRALELNAAAVILAHNHPSGVPEPSASDVVLTRDLADLLGRVDVRVLDHLVVARGVPVSFAERGLL